MQKMAHVPVAIPTTSNATVKHLMGSSDGYVVPVIAASVGQPGDRTINDSSCGSVDGSRKDTRFDNWSNTVGTAEQRFNAFLTIGWIIHQFQIERRWMVGI